MELEAAKMIGAGIAVLGVIGAAMGVGRVFASLIESIARNPSAKNDMQTFAFVGAALAEGLGIFALVIAFMIFLK